jgi:hypothetical protein
MASRATGLSESEDVKLLLKGIINELRHIRVQLSQQGEQIEELGRPNVSLNVLKTKSMCGLVSLQDLYESFTLDQQLETPSSAS